MRRIKISRRTLFLLLVDLFRAFKVQNICVIPGAKVCLPASVIAMKCFFYAISYSSHFYVSLYMFRDNEALSFAQ